MTTHSSILAWKIPKDRGAWWATVHGGLKESGKTEWLSTAQQKAVHILNPQNLQMISVPCLLSFFLFSLFLSFLFFSNYGM